MLWVAVALCSPACGPSSQRTSGDTDADRFSIENPPTPHPEIVEALLEDMNAPRHPSDGGGRAWLESDDQKPPIAVVSTPGRWTLVYEAGPDGIAVGGMLYLQVSPFWDWSTPQVEETDAPGFTEVSTSAPGIELFAATLDRQLLGIEIQGRPLGEGERIQIVYGAGPAGAYADRMAERGSQFWIAVDGDGDGVRKLIEHSPTIDVLPGPPAQLSLLVPSTARPGQAVLLHIAVLDAVGNAGVSAVGELSLHPLPSGLEGPETIRLAESDRGVAIVTLVAREPGVYRIQARGLDGLEAESNPLQVSASEPRILWADLHGHSNVSDGTGLPEDYFRYARDVAALDVAALTDHDHWGMRFLDQYPPYWESIREQVKRFHEPGRFVTLLGFEWTNWIHGHRHVLYFSNEGEVISSIDPGTDDPDELWNRLRGQRALTFAHHSAGGPVATNWGFAPDPVLEPVTEIVSVHGSSEAMDSPGLIYSPVPGNFVRDVLDHGYVLGFLGSGDSHDGHPGLAQLAAASGGLAAIFSEDCTREAVLEALRARRVYATNGPRIVLNVRLGGYGMGAAIPAAKEYELQISALTPRPLARLEVVRSGRIVSSLALEGEREIALGRTVEDLAADEYLYVRLTQDDGGAAWSSPFFVKSRVDSGSESVDE